MNRKQIDKANSLFFIRDQVQRRLDTVLSGSGVSVMITGDYQAQAVLDSVLEPMADHFRKEMAVIDEQLTALGWNDEQPEQPEQPQQPQHTEQPAEAEQPEQTEQ